MPSSNDKRHLVSGLHSRNTLPHLKREGASYFVTFRLAGTLPKEVLLQFKREREIIVNKALAARRPLTWAEQQEVFQWYSDRVDAYLDKGAGDCILKEPRVAKIVAQGLQFFSNARYYLSAWVIMPNHVHTVFRPTGGHTLSDILKSWKGFTAREINKASNRTGPVWQAEAYDHLIRDDDDMVRCCHYVTHNPVKARLCARAEDWPWSSVYKSVA